MGSSSTNGLVGGLAGRSSAREARWPAGNPAPPPSTIPQRRRSRRESFMDPSRQQAVPAGTVSRSQTSCGQTLAPESRFHSLPEPESGSRNPLVARRKRGEIHRLDDVPHFVRPLVDDRRAPAPLVRWKNRPLHGLADANRLREPRDRLPASPRLVAEDDDPGVLGPIGIDDRIEIVGAELSSQLLDDVRLTREEVPARAHALGLRE